MTDTPNTQPKEKRLYGDEIYIARIEELEARVAELEGGKPAAKPEKKKWPRVGSGYFGTDLNGSVRFWRWADNCVDRENFALGNVHNKRVDALAADAQLRGRVMFSRLADDAWEANSEKLNWRNANQMKYFLKLVDGAAASYVESETRSRAIGVVYFPSPNALHRAVRAVEAKYPGGLL